MGAFREGDDDDDDAMVYNDQPHTIHCSGPADATTPQVFFAGEGCCGDGKTKKIIKIVIEEKVLGHNNRKS